MVSAYYKTKVWVVAWTPKDAAEFAEEPSPPKPLQPIDAEANFQFTVPCSCHPGRWHYGSVMAVFTSREEAQVWRKEAGFDGFGIYPATLEVRKGR